MTIDINALAEFITAYSREVELEFDRIGRNSLPFHQEFCQFIAAYKASDGLAVFYMPGVPSNAAPGLYVFDHSEFSLNQLLQSLHLNRLQFNVPVAGSEFTPLDGPIEITELIPDINTYYFSDTVRQVMLSGKRSAPGLTITPIFDVANGVVSDVYPSRVKLWSPVIEYPGTGRIRYFFWNHADIWYRPEELSLPEAKATAKADLAAIRILLDVFGTLPIEQFGRDTNLCAGENLDREAAEFRNLLDERPHELVIHDWLVDHEHFLDPSATRILSKVPFGRYVSDFVVECADRTYELIEIEGVQRVFTQSGSEPCARFNHACTQARDWMRYVNENLRTVQIEQGLEGIYQPKGRVIMGRSEDIDTEEALLRWKHLKSEALLVDTYDDLASRVEYLANTLRSMLRQKTQGT